MEKAIIIILAIIVAVLIVIAVSLYRSCKYYKYKLYIAEHTPFDGEYDW